MKKAFAIFAAFLLTFSFALAQGGDDGYGNNYSGIDKTGPYNADDKADVGKSINDNGASDYSFDNAMGTYEAFVICKIDIECQNDMVYLGWLNPDGVKDVSNQPMYFDVTGGNGWPFELTTKVGSQVINGGHIASSFNGASGVTGDLDNVYITGGKWYYNNNFIGNGDVHNYQLKLSGTPGMFYSVHDQNDGWSQPTYDREGWNFGKPCGDCTENNYQRSCDNACQGKGQIKYIPGLLWASPDAEEGYYDFEVYTEVDYLTFVARNLVPTGNTYNDPSSYTAGQ